MADKVTADMVKTATMSLLLAVDQEGFYRNSYFCLAFPELTKTISGPKRRHPKKQGKPTVTFHVDGKEVAADVNAIADAINAYREARTSDE
jgi:hypothetical protein